MYNYKQMKIIIVFPIYLVSKDSEKYLITEKSFKYWNHLKSILKDENIELIFKIIGSEENLSKDLTLTYFNIDEYLEVSQGNVNYFNRENLNTVVGKKFLKGYEEAVELNPDLIFITKNNHFISRKYFIDVVNDYKKNPLSKNYYGMGHYKNNFILCTLNKDGNINYNDIYTNDIYIKTDMFDACLISIPKILYQNYKLNYHEFTEITLQNDLDKLGGIKHFIYNNYIFNIKSIDNNINITNLDSIKNLPIINKLNDIKILDNNLLYEDFNIINEI